MSGEARGRGKKEGKNASSEGNPVGGGGERKWTRRREGLRSERELVRAATVACKLRTFKCVIKNRAVGGAGVGVGGGPVVKHKTRIGGEMQNQRKRGSRQSEVPKQKAASQRVSSERFQISWG